jgi:DNA-binding PucR family transcriptional regulator
MGQCIGDFRRRTVADLYASHKSRGRRAPGYGARLRLDVDDIALMRQRTAEVAASLDAVPLGRAMADVIIARIPELTESADDDFRTVLVGSCTSNLRKILEGLVEDKPPDEATPPPDATAWAHELVHRGQPLAALLRAYRLGHWLFEQTFTEASAGFDLDPELRLRVCAGASQHCFAYIDVVCTQLVDEYEAEREQWMRGAAAAQVELVQAIVAGEPLDPADAAAVLRYDVLGPQVAIVVWHDPTDRHAVGEGAAPAARRLALALGATETLVVPVGEHAAWAWATGERLLDEVPAELPAADRRLHAVVGDRHEGLDGMRRSHLEARAARRVGELVGARRTGVVAFRSVALNALLTADEASARVFARRELGRLAEDTDAALRLRATVRVHLDERLSPIRTARRLGIHENTVVYRVKRAEELLGRPLDERRPELEVALRLFDALPRG